MLNLSPAFKNDHSTTDVNLPIYVQTHPAFIFYLTIVKNVLLNWYYNFILLN